MDRVSQTGMKSRALRLFALLAVVVLMLTSMPDASAQRGGSGSTTSTAAPIKAGTPSPDGGVYGRSSRRSVIRNGSLVAQTARDTMARDSLAVDSLAEGLVARDSLSTEGIAAAAGADSMAMAENQHGMALLNASTPTAVVEKAERERYFSDSMSLSRVAWTAALLPGFGQVYNKQYWKLPIMYGAIAGGITLFVKENKKYQPLKAEYDEMTLLDPRRTVALNELQEKMIRSNTRRQIYLGATIASYIYTLGDAAMNYSTNDVSDIKRATTLATICPGAGQIYNKSYWKVPFVVGGFAMMTYVIDWNNRGYQRFKKAYNLRSDYDENPDDYPDGSADEFGGRYSADYLQSLRDSYRRNRDLSFIFVAGLYVLQIIDAHVDAHFKDFDISDDLSMNIEPSLGYSYSPTNQRECATYGFNVGIKF